MKKTVLRKYAQLIARSGVNIQKGQEVIIRAGLDQPEFIRILVEECYRAGAKKVNVDWSYDVHSRLNFLYADGFLPEDFNDSSHLTDTGAVKLSKMLSGVIYPH